jgi:mono/diheme cytochrome c family protein
LPGSEWNRGAYLVQGLGHCGACHTPRGWAFQEKALDQTQSGYLSGNELDNWSASNLTGDPNTGLGRWTERDIRDFLKRGRNRYAAAFGTMIDVITTAPNT